MRPVLLLIATLGAVPAAHAATFPFATTADGTESQGFIRSLDVSADGRFVAFEADADDLIPGVTGGQIYLKDTVTGALSLVSRRQDGTPASGGSRRPSVSDDGRLVLFTATDDSIETGVTRPGGGVYLRDLQLGTITHVLPGWADVPQLSRDGRVVVFHAQSSASLPGPSCCGRRLFRYDLDTETITVVSRAVDSPAYSGDAVFGAMSGDGRFITFRWQGPGMDADIVPAGSTASTYRHDAADGTIVLASRSDDGNPVIGIYSGISDNGRYVSFNDADGVYLRDIHSARTTVVDHQTGSFIDFDRTWVTADGRFLAWQRNGGDTGSGTFMRDLVRGSNIRFLAGAGALESVLAAGGGAFAYTQARGAMRRPLDSSVSLTISAPTSVQVRDQYIVTLQLTNRGDEPVTGLAVRLETDQESMPVAEVDSTGFQPTFLGCGFNAASVECATEPVPAGESRVLRVVLDADLVGEGTLRYSTLNLFDDFDRSDDSGEHAVEIRKRDDSGGGGLAPGLLLVFLWVLRSGMRLREARV